jgi:hypothetical protein
MSQYNDIRKTINNTGGFTLEQKRALRELARTALGDSPAAANQAAASLQAGAAAYKVAIEEKGDLVYTRILVDLTGLNSGGAGDVIGVNASTDSAAIFHVTEAECGTVIGGRLFTYETPLTGDDDIDVVLSATGTTAEDAAPTSGTTVVNSGNIAAGDTDNFTSFDMAKPYIYLVGATGADATYTAGIVEIELVGYRA